MFTSIREHCKVRNLHASAVAVPFTGATRGELCQELSSLNIVLVERRYLDQGMPLRHQIGGFDPELIRHARWNICYLDAIAGIRIAGHRKGAVRDELREM